MILPLPRQDYSRLPGKRTRSLSAAHDLCSLGGHQIVNAAAAPRSIDRRAMAELLISATAPEARGDRLLLAPCHSAESVDSN
jgi:hypothetical protein